ncbi:MAG: cation:proton antiporter [Gemmatimonadota bacterium]
MKSVAVCSILVVLAALAPTAGAAAPHDAAWALGLLMVLAFLGQQLAEYLRLPPICGWLAAGLTLGAGGLGAVRPAEVPALHLAHLFTALWLGFEVGLGTTWSAARRSWVLPLTVGLSTVAAVALVTAGATFLLHLPWELALFLGALAALWGPFAASTLSHSDEAVLVGAFGSAFGLAGLAGVLLLLREQGFLAPAAARVSRDLWLSVAGGAAAAEVLWRARVLARRTPAVVGLVTCFCLTAAVLTRLPLFALPFGFAAGLVLAGHEERSRLLRHLLDPARRLAAMVFFALVGASLDPDPLFRAPAPGLYEILLLQAVVLVLLRGVGATVWYPQRQGSGFSRAGSWLLLPGGALAFELVLRPDGGLLSLVPAAYGQLVAQLVTAQVLIYGFGFAALAAATVSLFGGDEPAPAV